MPKDDNTAEKNGQNNSDMLRYFGYLKFDRKQTSVHCEFPQRQVMPSEVGSSFRAQTLQDFTVPTRESAHASL